MFETLRIDSAALDRLVLRRENSQFASDLHERQADLRAAVAGKRILVVGGAGTIGSSTTMLISRLAPAALHVVDQSENYLAELVRDLRGRPGGLDIADFRTLPIDYGAPVMGRFLSESAPYDIVMNFAALKHVRSEKDVYSLLQMIDTNVVRHVRFKRWLAQYGHGARYFAVSTDKAANPTSLMGASKRLMEDIVFDIAVPEGALAVSARFANVAFSNGSLLQGFLYRLSKGQPLAAPRDTRRYFVSQQESGEICALAALLGGHEQVLFPKLDPVAELQLLEDVACRVLGHAGLTPELFDDEDAARAALPALRDEGRWPLLITALDTSGEKPYEEFVGHGEQQVDTGLSTLGAVRHLRSRAISDGVVSMLENAVNSVDGTLDKRAIVAAIESAIPNFSHRETGRNLDERL
ncbi:polysaccharide biosynthesis protein [Lysobacter gummosus]|jgi:FlaA1/EpsC-like NDP-sugar epimerase|uniref:Polysaccharide biosynthesis protein n=1 Tax=Lysobacter gummosus TaxID=262324 RepID=A0ABY3X7R9_9GAMM|nr:polysaccharide biosynthesis protein [Lysobacter gummosus]ALN93113.1 UDP-N-acetylglucosamine 4,6-dehydratase [Lysobacter gummosus]UNP28622.1 polysaccharide biosynthesis protein [Lysobacter gummosus]